MTVTTRPSDLGALGEARWASTRQSGGGHIDSSLPAAQLTDATLADSAPRSEGRRR